MEEVVNMDIVTYALSKKYADSKLTSIYKYCGQCTNTELKVKTASNGDVWEIVTLDVYIETSSQDTDPTYQQCEDAYNNAMSTSEAPIGAEMYNTWNGRFYYKSAETSWTRGGNGYRRGADVVYGGTGWTELTGQMHINVEDSCNSTSTQNALSANQGKILKELIDALDARIAALEPHT